MTELPRLTIVGYADRQSVAPGETIRFMVSAESEAPTYCASLRRMHSFDASAGGCGLIEDAVAAAFEAVYPARRQSITTGSYVRFPRTPTIALSSFTATAWLWPTTPETPSTVLGLVDPTTGAGVCLRIDTAGRLALALHDGTHEIARVTGPRPLLAREWIRVVATYDAAAGRVQLSQKPARPYPGLNVESASEAIAPRHLQWSGGSLTLAAETGATGPTAFYNGKIDRPRLFARALGDCEAERSLAETTVPQDLAADCLGFWDFSREMHATQVVDLSPAGRHGETVNLPARAMTGFNWCPGTNDFTRDPDQYGAIHFHDDDLYDAEWKTDFTWTVPEDLPSGVYAAKLEDGGMPGYVVFFVRPPRRAGAARPKVLFLAPTAHYLAYANYRLTERDAMSEAYRGRLWQFGPEDVLLEHRPEFGNSTYERHTDGSGVCYSSYLRPVLNMRPNTRLSSLAGDGYVLAFLRHHGVAYDVLTDEDLDREGAKALAPYDVVLTGGHPEYVSKPMWDALTAFLGRGGRLMYLGGNGFYWRIAFHPTLSGVMEVRRGEDGTRPWVSEPGEYYMSFTGEYGGLWRRNGLAPNVLVGVGFTAQGFDVATHYRRRPGAEDPRAAFIFRDVPESVIGDYGVGYGGAAGQEIDRYDLALGSPPHALVLASSEGHTDNMLLANEDLDATHLRVGGVENELVRADMVFFETAGGGAVFSTGSISWVAAMPWNNFDNGVARITRNVLERFRDPTPFVLPDTVREVRG